MCCGGGLCVSEEGVEDARTDVSGREGGIVKDDVSNKDEGGKSIGQEFSRIRRLPLRSLF